MSVTFEGQSVLVTGAASGIGKACAEAFLDRGAAVAGLDRNPAISNLFDRKSFHALVCDVGDEEAIKQALQQAKAVLGGLDILVLNAGIFPPSCAIDSLKLSDWRTIMRVNVEANVVFLREAHALLKAGKPYGRVVVMGSQRVHAPAEGTVAYSASKAALVQLARVATLEWARDGIRVNVVSPGRVCDTAAFPESILRDRAKHYGMSIEDYKRNNLLHVDLTSAGVGNFVAEICGPAFSSVTGAHLFFDGGDTHTV